MDEQMMPEPSPQIPETSSIPEPDYTPEPEPIEDYDAPPMPDGRASEIALDDETGDVKFSEDFFDNKPESQPDLEQPRYYTHEELQNTPFEQWQKERVPEELRDYYDIVANQLQSRNIQRQIQQRPATPPAFEAPRQYTPKELSEEAQRIAVERLGLEDPDDFDDYEPEHRAALNMAMNELVQQNYAARQNYARIAQSYQNLQQFNAQLAARSDYKEFDSWFDGKLKELKITPQVMDNYLTNYARQTGNYGAIQNALAGWYSQFLQEKGTSRAPAPPMMESSRGQPYETYRGVNLRDFGDMDTDGQAKELMRMGFI